MEVKENPDRFKATCKSILDFITEYAKADVSTRGNPYREIEIDDSTSVPVSLNNTSVNGYDFIVGIRLRGIGYPNTGFHMIIIKFCDDRMIYIDITGYRESRLYEQLLIEIFKDAMIDLNSNLTGTFYELLVDTNKYINISEMQPTSYNRQKALLEHCIANNFSIYSDQLTLFIEHTDIDWMFKMLPHFKGLVKLNCNLHFSYQSYPLNPEFEETSEGVARRQYTANTCKEAEEKLIRILSIDVQECTVSNRFSGYHGQNIADRIKHKFYLASIYLPFKNHPLMDSRLIDYIYKFM
jgi:hypothetical protein